MNENPDRADRTEKLMIYELEKIKQENKEEFDALKAQNKHLTKHL